MLLCVGAQYPCTVKRLQFSQKPWGRKEEAGGGTGGGWKAGGGWRVGRRGLEGNAELLNGNPAKVLRDQELRIQNIFLYLKHFVHLFIVCLCMFVPMPVSVCLCM